MYVCVDTCSFVCACGGKKTVLGVIKISLEILFIYTLASESRGCAHLHLPSQLEVHTPWTVGLELR